MSRHTTGELAKRCGVTVRTVQYYDSRGILVPTELSVGGRRLYAEKDVQKLKLTCTQCGARECCAETLEEVPEAQKLPAGK